jgi:hypothetical protein
LEITAADECASMNQPNVPSEKASSMSGQIQLRTACGA